MSENSIEPRPVYSKNIIKLALNLPLKHKLNLNFKNKKLINKPVLKSIFIKYFGKKYLLENRFSGFLNESMKYLDFKDKKQLNKFFIYLNLKSKEFIWKILNIYYFAKFNNIKIEYNKIK